MKTEIKNDCVIAYPQGRIDSQTANDYLEEFLKIIGENEGLKLEINMEGIEYVSSAGLRIFLKIQKTVKDLKLTELSPDVYDVFNVTGFTDIMNVRKVMRRISVDGCEIIGRGFYGTVYRIDEDTIVKVYESPESIPMIENEQLRAKQAFRSGIPTAISYDIVRVGDSYGSVFEMLKAKTLNDLVIENPENVDDITAKYVDFIKTVHGTVMEKGTLPYARDEFIDHLDVEREFLDDDIYDTLKKYLSELPQDDHVVHGDIMMKNVMMADGELLLIDMDTLMAGQPVFDLAGLYVAYMAFPEDEPGNSEQFLGITDAMAEHIWNEIFNRYFSGFSDEEKATIFDKIKIVAYIRFLFIMAVTDYKNGELGAIRIKHTKQHLRELLSRVDNLYFSTEPS